MTSILAVLHANDNWIKIEPISTMQTPKKETPVDINLTQIKPVNKMLKQATVIKQIIDATSKTKKKKPTNDKNWFIINEDNN